MGDLPPLNPVFRWSNETWGVALRCRPLADVAQHLFTTKQLQLRGGAPLDIARAWQLAAKAVGAEATATIRVKQVHGRTVRVVDKGMPIQLEVNRTPEADAIVSNVPGVLLAVQVADCVPILMADSRSGAVAAVHAGWRGTSARVASAAIDAMAREFGTKPADLVAAIGPSIGPCCYEVGPELIDTFRAQGASESALTRWFTDVNGSLRLDLWSASRDQLLESGVPAGRIHACALCTKTHAQIFDSYRADGPNAGRSAALIAVPDA
jgi:YfiH family protein